MNVPFVGCASHKLNLAVMKYLSDHEDIVHKINELMQRLKTAKLSGALRHQTPLRPMTRNRTRWSSTFAMLKRYEEIRSFVQGIGDESLLDLILSPREEKILSNLIADCDKMQSVTLALQRSDISMSQVRLLFDGLCSSFPSFSHYLSQDSPICSSSNFESAVAKIDAGKCDDLSFEELEAATALKEASVSGLNDSGDFATALLKRQRLDTKFRSVKFILPTSNIVERFFSLASHSLSDYRERISPQNLEMQLFLSVNKSFWTVEDVNSALIK